MSHHVIRALGLAILSFLAWQTFAGDAPPAGRDAAWVDQRILDWQPTPRERALDQIGWAPTLGEAWRLAREHGRPVMLFTYDGASFDRYRC